MAITTFIPEVWTARLAEHYTRNLVFGQLLNRNYEGDIAQYGDTVHINSLEDVAVKQYTPNVKIEDPEQLTAVDQILTIDQGRYYNFYVDDVDAAQARGDLMDAAMRNASYKLSQDTEDYIVTQLLEGGIKLSGAPSADNIYAEIIKIKTAMDEADVPREGRRLVVPPAVEGLLLQDNKFISTNAQGQPNNLINGYVGRVAGFDLYSSTALEDNMIAFREADATFANQLTKTEAYRPEKQFADAVKGLALFGAKVTNPDAVAVYTITGG